MNKTGILSVVSGFSGAGKGTITKELLKRYNYCLSISATTRKPREGEEDGREYFFKTKEEFESMISNKELIEWAEYVGNYYGTPIQYVKDKLDEGYDVILEIETKGAILVKEAFPEALLLFITAPSITELKNRLIGRGTEDILTVEKRLEKAKEEVECIQIYDYLIVNNHLEDCTNEIHEIIQREHFKVSNNIEFIHTIKKELEAFAKGDI